MRKILPLLAITLLLSACIGAKRAPDETRVVAGPSLMLPPEYNLTPPKAGISTPAERAAAQKIEAAQSSLLGDTTEGQETSKTSEPVWFIKDKTIDPAIREKLTAEDTASKEKEAKETWLDKVKNRLEDEK